MDDQCAVPPFEDETTMITGFSREHSTPFCFPPTMLFPKIVGVGCRFLKLVNDVDVVVIPLAATLRVFCHPGFVEGFSASPLE